MIRRDTLSIPGRRWERINSMDLIMKLPKTADRGHDSFLVFVDLLFKSHRGPTRLPLNCMLTLCNMRTKRALEN